MLAQVLSFLAGAGAMTFMHYFFPDLLARRTHERTEQARIAAEQREEDRRNAPVRAQIAAMIRDEVRSLQRVFIHGSFTLEEWQQLHAHLVGFQNDDGARALGNHYQTFVDAVTHDQLCINIQTDRTTAWLEAANPESAPAKREGQQRDALTQQNVASSVLSFVTVMHALGLEDAARTEHSALQAQELASYTLSLPPA